VRDATREAARAGALETIATEAVVVEEDGIPFVVRHVSSLVRKERARRVAAQADPFLPPEPVLTLGAVPPRHVAVLNKFNVLPRHVLLVTDEFRHQEELVDEDDLRALWWALGELPSLGFYNGGVVAGASQAHKHLQLVPLPLGRDVEVPVEERLRAVARVPGRVVVGAKPFHHAFVPLPPLDDEAAPILHELFREALHRLGLDPLPGSPARQAAPYNLLLTRRFLLVVPRRREHFADVSVNALGFAGSLFVRTAAQLARVRDVGPLAVLRAVVSG
jgi:ATP adenylyltransferase